MRSIVLIGAACLLIGIGSVPAAMRGGPHVQQTELPPLSATTFAVRGSQPFVFIGGARASAVAIGNGDTFLGVYAFDSHGNCVAKEDNPDVRGRDDIVIDWVPTRTESYSVEVVNFGRFPNPCKVALK